MTVTSRRIACRALTGVAVLLAVPAVLIAGSTSQCKLRPGLYQERKGLESEYAAKVGNEYALHRGVADRLNSRINDIDAQYYNFTYAMANFAARGDTVALDACRKAAEQDPIARMLAALVWYVHSGRRDPASFTASFPKSKAQMDDFWSLDAVTAHGTRQEPPGLPGIPLPDGVVDKFISELFDLVQRGNTAAIREYLNLYSNADGEYAEFMQDQMVRLFKEDPGLVLRKWGLFRPCGQRLGASEDISPEDYRDIRLRFKSLCRKTRNRDCAEILEIFH